MIEDFNVYVVKVDCNTIGVFSSAFTAVITATSAKETHEVETAITRSLTDGGLISIMFRRADDKVVEIERYTLNAVGGAQ